MSEFRVQDNLFMLDGAPVRLLAGAIHYFRIVPEYWADRLQKLRACGFNAVETYVPWNFHEPKPGQFRFDGMADLVRFVRTAEEAGLLVILRPSPYICAEWEFGGLPAWLLADPGMRVRCAHPAFLERVAAYYDELLPRLKPLLCTNGGPIVAMQVENEYGSYGNDKAYLKFLRDAMVSRGMDVLLFTSDGPEHHMLQGGMIPGVLETVNFGSRAAEAFASLREYQPEGPLMCMEFWNGWFDHWGEEHHVRDADDAAAVFAEMLDLGASVNFYMFHGGTNFGFWSGANCHVRDRYEPTVTSYDYNSPLDESGRPTDKYYAISEALSRVARVPDAATIPAPIPKAAYGTAKADAVAPLFASLDALSAPVRSPYPRPMEELGQSSGFILYETWISGPRAENELVLQECRDRALVFLDNDYLGVIERGNAGNPIRFAVPEGGARLRLLVENMGRINYGPYMHDRKGITEGVRHGLAFLFDWTIHPLPLEDLTGLAFAKKLGSDGDSESFTGSAAETDSAFPAFYRTELHISQEPADTFLKLDGWVKGVVFVNGFNLGRYWNRGPQRTLYVPAPLLRSGKNEIVVFELHHAGDAVLQFTDRAELG